MAPVVSFHRVSLRPSARLSDLRLVFTDRHAAKRHHPGLRYMVSGLCGSRATNGMALPPSPSDREIVAFWDDEAAYDAFLDGPVMKRWRKSGEVFSVALHPIVARGDWGGTNPLADMTPTPASDGPVVAVTYARLRLRDAFAWYTRIAGPAGRAMAQAPGLLGGTGGANWTGLTTFTMSVWPDKRTMLGSAYGKGNDHSGKVAWGKDHLDISIGHFVAGKSEGRWIGTNFSLGEGRDARAPA